MKSEEIKQPIQNDMSLANFLESVPPGQTAILTDEVKKITRYTIAEYKLKLPDLHLHCTSEACNGLRFFAPSNSEVIHLDVGARSPDYQFLRYVCRNCGRNTRIFSLSAKLDANKQVEVHKLGEVPSFGPPIPARLISLIGGDRELFLKGRRAENQGLGIAAFAYYRRVVESQKAKIFEEILRVSTTLKAEEGLIRELKAAQSENQFSKAIESIKHGIPQVLLIKGHNPLILLHGALSEGLHEKSDEHCLEQATSIRVVLTDLAERIAQALKDEAELNVAVSKLLRKSTVDQKGRNQS